MTKEDIVYEIYDLHVRPAAIRVYCWRVGRPVVVQPGAGVRCPECGSPNHQQVEDGVCAEFAECMREETRTFGSEVIKFNTHDHGHRCELPTGHDGPHECPAARAECLSND